MVKKIAALLVLVLSAAVVYGEAPTRVAVDNNYEWALDTTVDNDGAYDTLAALDSINVVATRFFKTGYEYIVVRDAITGTGTDSLYMALYLYCYDNGGNLLYTVTVDSATAAAGEAYLLPIGQTAFGAKYTVKFKGYGDNGGQQIFNRLYIYKRRVLSQDKRLW